MNDSQAHWMKNSCQPTPHRKDISKTYQSLSVSEIIPIKHVYNSTFNVGWRTDFVLRELFQIGVRFLNPLTLLWKFFQCSHCGGTVKWVQTSPKVTSYILPSYTEIRNAGKRHFYTIITANELGKSYALTGLESLTQTHVKSSPWKKSLRNKTKPVSARNLFLLHQGFAH